MGQCYQRILKGGLALAGVLSMVGCTTLSGLDGETKFSCKAPDGVTCSSLSGVYANAVADNLPALRKEKGGEAGQTDATGHKPTAIVGTVPSSGDPIRTAPKVLRIWVAPFEDSEGDLHDQSYIYVVAHPGRWMVEHNQKRIADRYRPTFIQAGKGGGTQAKAPAVQGQQPQSQSIGGVVLPGSQLSAPAGSGAAEESSE